MAEELYVLSHVDPQRRVLDLMAEYAVLTPRAKRIYEMAAESVKTARQKMVIHYIESLWMWVRGAGTVSSQGGQIFLEKIRPTLVFSLPTLDLITWVGKDPPAIT